MYCNLRRWALVGQPAMNLRNKHDIILDAKVKVNILKQSCHVVLQNVTTSYLISLAAFEEDFRTLHVSEPALNQIEPTALTCKATICW